MELAELAGLQGEALEDAFYLGLLHSIGCTADAPVTARAFGDDRAHKAAYTLIDPGRSIEIVHYLWRNVYPTAPRPERLRAFVAAMAAGPEFARVNMRSHCEVGERLGERLRLPARVREGLWFVFERWTERGCPPGSRGRTLRGSSLDPSLSAVLCDHAGELLERVSSVDAWERVVALEPRPRIFIGDELAQACQVIADYADLKSYGTLGHSRAVAELAEAAGWRLGFDAGAVGDLRCAAWLHDLGRVGVSSAVWEKPGPLTSGEWEQVRLHSYHSERLLARIPAFAELARTAASDHERLDGSGYHRGRCGSAAVARGTSARGRRCVVCDERAARLPARCAQRLRRRTHFATWRRPGSLPVRPSTPCWRRSESGLAQSPRRRRA